MKELKIKATLTEEMLGTACSDPNIHSKYIASKAPDAEKTEEEVESVENATGGTMTVFPRADSGEPFMYDYQIKGYFKDQCSAIRKIKGSLSEKLKSYKKQIDGLIFVEPRQIKINLSGDVGHCERPLRASTPQGERITLASSETAPAGSTVSFTVICMVDEDVEIVKEWLDYGRYRGFGQWRNSGKGRFDYEIID